MWLHHLGLGGIIEGAFQIVKRHLRALMLISAVFVIPSQLVTVLLNLAVLPRREALFDGSHTTTVYIEQHSWAAVLGVVVVSALLSLVLHLIAAGALAHIASQVYLGNDADVDTSLKYALRRYKALFAAAVLATLGIAVGLAACIIPGIFFGVAWSVTTPALVVEELPARRALGRSYELANRRWWRTFGYLIMFSLLVGIPSIAATLIVSGIFDRRTAAGVIVTGIVQAVIGLVTTPLGATMSVLLYFDLRSDHDGVLYAYGTRQAGSPPPNPPQQFS